MPKDKVKIRPIIDLSLMNRYVVSPSFRMEDLKKATKGIQDPSWAAKVDIQDAFLSVLISTYFQRYFVFWINNRVYMFKRMPFNLTTALWVFTRLMRVVKKFLRRKGVKINFFIDDFLIWSNFLERTSLHLDWTKSPGVVRLPDKPQEDLYNSFSTDHLPGRGSRPSEPDHEPPLRKSKPSHKPCNFHNQEMWSLSSV